MRTLEDISEYKLRTIVIFFLFSLLAVCIKLVHLQIKLAHLFLDKSTKNFLHVETVSSPRGNIVDCNGKLLATNRPTHNIFWKGSGKRSLTQAQIQKLEKLENIMNVPLKNDTTLLKKITHAERHYKKVLLAADVRFEQLSKLEEQFPQETNITIETSFKRFYPHASYASHILGYLGKIKFGLIGKMGLEHLFEHTLKGKPGSIMATINSFGKKLTETSIEQAISGADIETTLDLELQDIVENVFPSDQTGTCIVMDTENGAILAMTSRPNFDPTIFLEPILQEDWNAMQNEHPFLNRAFNASYPPGSIFKLVVASAALEQGIITPDTIWDCKGYITLAGRRYHCHVLEGHGKLTVSQALEQSCNPLFYDIGTKISIDTLADYAYRFGLGEKTNILFPEKKGLVPSSEWKLENIGERWWPGETLSAAIGQSFLLVTPIQVARMTAGIFTGKLVTPRILADENITSRPLDIQPETLEFLRKSMKKVVTQGTGRRINRVKDIEVYAKTSTAQTSALHKRHQGRIYQEHGWFVAQFRYKKNRPLIIVVLIEHTGSSQLPTIVARRFLIRYKKLVDKVHTGGQYLQQES